MRFRNCIIDPQIERAWLTAESLLSSNSMMINELRLKKDWRYNSANVADELLKVREPVNIYVYKYKNPFTRAIGHFDGKAIYISTKVISNFNFKTVTGLLLHEYAHYCGFGHGNNFKTAEKCLYSVPYYLSENCDKWI